MAVESSMSSKFAILAVPFLNYKYSLDMSKVALSNNDYARSLCCYNPTAFGEPTNEKKCQDEWMIYTFVSIIIIILIIIIAYKKCRIFIKNANGNDDNDNTVYNNKLNFKFETKLITNRY